jgi:peptidoglycan/xylan/chitin deacetylase (PgdA/CDA1 family)
MLRYSGLTFKAGSVIEAMKHRPAEEREQWMADLERSTGEVEATPHDRILSWEEVRDMADAGVQFGSHTQTHSILTQVAAEVAESEITGSRNAIEQMLGTPCEAFAYPNGDWSSELRGLVERAGYCVACTTEPGAWTAASHPLSVPRINVCEENVVSPWGEFSPALFGYTTYWKAWRAERRKHPAGRQEDRSAAATAALHAPGLH